MIKKLIIVAVLLVALYVGVDFGIRPLVANETENVLENSQFIPTSDAKVSIGGFPFLLPLVLSGRVPELTIELRDVDVDVDAEVNVVGISVGVVSVAQVDVRVTDLEVDRGGLTNGVVTIRGVGEVAVDARITEDALSDALGYEVRLRESGAKVVVAGVAVDAELRIEGATLIVTAPGGLQQGLALPAEYLPCQPELELGDSELHAACTADTLPDALDGWLTDVGGDTIPGQDLDPDTSQPTELEEPVTLEPGG